MQLNGMTLNAAGSSYPAMLARLHQATSSPATVPISVISPVAIPSPPTFPGPAAPQVAILPVDLHAAYRNLVKRLADFAKQVFTPTPATPEQPGVAEPQPAAASYVVQAGDTLSAIAKRTLGDGNRWREIYDLNRDVIGSNPNLIHAGRTLALPGGTRAAPALAAPSKPSGKWAWPVDGRRTSDYGNREHPITGEHKFHTGLDIGAAAGTPARTPLAGTVSFAGRNGGYGNYVMVDHGNGIQTAYAHLSAIDVSKGQSVGARDVVGKVGSTGMSTGPHLHFEVKENGKFVDPDTYLA